MFFHILRNNFTSLIHTMPLPPSPAPSPFIDGNPVVDLRFALVIVLGFFLIFVVGFCIKWQKDQREAQRSLVELQRPHRQSPNSDQAAARAQTKRPKAPGVFKYARESCSFDSTECAICLKKYMYGEVCRLLPKYKHTFHRKCVDKWLTKGSDCPLCRAEV